MSKKSNSKNRTSNFNVTETSELLIYLTTVIKDKNRNKIKSMLKHRQVMVNKKVITQFNQPLKANDIVTIGWDKGFEKTNLQGLNIIFEDDDIIVINKRSGVLSIGSNKEKRQTVYRSLTQHIQKENPSARLFVVHRLDRDASGLMVFAKNKSAQLELQDTWKKTAVQRKYLVLAEGSFEEDSNTIKSYLRESKALIMYSSNNPKDGKIAISNYSVIKKNEHYTLLEAWQETERKNQIRVHLKSIGHSIVGDTKYEAKTNPLSRMGLHAKILTFQHPTTHQLVTYETKAPEDFLKVFRKNYKG